MSIQKIRKTLKESLFGNTPPKVGFMEYDYSNINIEQFDDFFNTVRDQLNQVSVNTKVMRNLKDQKRIIIVTTQDKVDTIEDVFKYFNVPCVKSIFDTKPPNDNAQNNYPETSDVQNTRHRLF